MCNVPPIFAYHPVRFHFIEFQCIEHSHKPLFSIGHPGRTPQEHFPYKTSSWANKWALKKIGERPRLRRVRPDCRLRGAQWRKLKIKQWAVHCMQIFVHNGIQSVLKKLAIWKEISPERKSLEGRHTCISVMGTRPTQASPYSDWDKCYYMGKKYHVLVHMLIVYAHLNESGANVVSFFADLCGRFEMPIESNHRLFYRENIIFISFWNLNMKYIRINQFFFKNSICKILTLT